jgi:hypothetical protein
MELSRGIGSDQVAEELRQVQERDLRIVFDMIDERKTEQLDWKEFATVISSHYHILTKFRLYAVSTLLSKMMH